MSHENISTVCNSNIQTKFKRITILHFLHHEDDDLKINGPQSGSGSDLNSSMAVPTYDFLIVKNSSQSSLLIKINQHTHTRSHSKWN